MVKQKIFNHKKYDRAVTVLGKDAAKKRARDMRKSLGANNISVRVVKAGKNYNDNAYIIYYRLK